MPAFFDNETKVIPETYYDDRSFFFKCSLMGSKFFCDIFNAAFDFSYQNGSIPKKRKFKEKQFILSDIKFNPTQRMLLVQLPLPVFKKDRELTYLKYYCIPYIQYENRIKILDLFGVQGASDGLNQDLIIKFVKDSDFIPCAVVDGNKHATIKALRQTVFKKYNPLKKRADS